MIRAEVPSYPVSIFVAGGSVESTCRAYCDRVGLCVTVTPTRYVYTDGAEDGWIIGLINYGRFPSSPDAIFARAEALAEELIASSEGVIQSATVQAPDRTLWLNARDRDAMQARKAGGFEPRRGRSPVAEGQSPTSSLSSISTDTGGTEQ